MQALLAQVPNRADVHSVAGFLQAHQQPEPQDVANFVRAHPGTASFFGPGGPFSTFTRELLAHASGRGFLLGAFLGVVSVIAAIVLINVKKTDLPSER